ncbi:MAG: alginate O-acetyltransferase complex protein AlgJ [Verrucomicrobiota bacterium]|jgi:alginate O-acetyltransferase complex protein AlgJ
MRFFCTLLLLAVSAARLAAQDFPGELGKIVQNLEKTKAAAVAGNDGWIFFGGELRLLSLGKFWGDDAREVSRAHKPELADPIPAILDFQEQLKARGIELLLVPVPPKAAVYPEKIVTGYNVAASDPAPSLHRFYQELTAAGVNVLDLTATLVQNRDHPKGPVFCKTDSHWSGVGCVLAAQAIAEKVRGKIQKPAAAKEYVAEWKEAEREGDLASLVARDGRKSLPEKIAIQSVSEKGTGAAVQDDANSPLLLLGDSHTLIYHDREFLPVRAGLVDQLALQLGIAPDLIGTSGSGATPVRISLYRRSVKDPGYLAKKKVVVWCFAAREFTEATEGWAKVPVAK